MIINIIIDFAKFLMKVCRNRPICELRLKPNYEDIDEDRPSGLPQDNVLCSRGGGGGIIQLFIENGGTFLENDSNLPYEFIILTTKNKITSNTIKTIKNWKNLFN
jgi:hypothetical protein